MCVIAVSNKFYTKYSLTKNLKLFFGKVENLKKEND